MASHRPRAATGGAPGRAPEPARIASTLSRLARATLLLSPLALLAGCDWVLLAPEGDVARQQSNLMITATILMLLIVVPVIVMTLWFAWRFRESNPDADYRPEWDHSTQIELYVWAAPLLIIIAIGAMTWISTHVLDPFAPLSRISPDQPIAADHEPLEIQAIALRWKWLFIYPEHNIAVVNEVAAPVDQPIRFYITSPEMMNSLYIPSLAGMVYGMPGMQTQIQAVMNAPGSYYGVSGNYSGEGYSHMRFDFLGLSDGDFQQWVDKAKNTGDALSFDAYRDLAEPSVAVPVRRYADVAPELYHRILNLCVEPGKMCKDAMMAHGPSQVTHAPAGHDTAGEH